MPASRLFVPESIDHRSGLAAALAALLLLGVSVRAQTPPNPQTASSAAVPAQSIMVAVPSPNPAAPSVAPAASSVSQHTVIDPQVAKVTQDLLEHQLLNQTFYLRGGYIEDKLHFLENGRLDGTALQASHTLNLVEITHVRLQRHDLQLEGIRYGLHFLDSVPSEDHPAQDVDKVRLTARKKRVLITIARDGSDTSKKRKSGKEAKADRDTYEPSAAEMSVAPSYAAASSPAPPAATATTTAGASATTAPVDSERSKKKHKKEHSAPAAEPAVPTLTMALNRIFARGIDDNMVAALPPYWGNYYRQVASGARFQPSDPAVLRQNQVDQKARLIAALDPASNDYAQANGVAGLAMYHVVVGADGRATEIVVGRPIGIGLDENAVAVLKKATFEPAMKDGKPVPVVLDVTVQFRIYSSRTNVVAQAAPASVAAPAAAVVPISTQKP